MHVLQRKGATIRAADNRDDLFHRCDFKAEYVVDKDRAIHVGVTEAVGLWIKLRMQLGLPHTKGIKICD